MTAFETLAALLTIAAVFAYVNHRWIRQPTAIALMAMSLAASTILIVLDRLGWHELSATATSIVEHLDLDDTLLHGMLGSLLFAGALHIRLTDLREQRLAIITLAVGGTVLSAFIVAALAYLLLPWLGLYLSFGHCMLFGALISPTDPIAILGILKRAGVPRSMEIQIAGESLFNDGVGVVIFLTVAGIVSQGERVTVGHVVGLFAREALGGALFGFGTGYLTYRLLRSIDHYQTELLLTLALVLGGYTLAERLHLSAPIAAVVAGLVIGNQGRAQGMSETTRDHLDKFWDLVDEIMNASLFVLVGFELIRLSLTRRAAVAGLCMIPVVLLARLVSVAAPIAALSRVTRFARGSLAVLTWGGLRGGISVALALSTPLGGEHDLLVSMTYFVVVFSIFAQGLTLSRVARRAASHAVSP
jgi:CPA1 family monovalent cation:H+ antiporter